MSENKKVTDKNLFICIKSEFLSLAGKPTYFLGKNQVGFSSYSPMVQLFLKDWISGHRELKINFFTYFCPKFMAYE